MADTFYELVGRSLTIRLSATKSDNAGDVAWNVTKEAGGANELGAMIVDLTDPVGKGLRFTGPISADDTLTAIFALTATVQCTHNTATTKVATNRITITRRADDAIGPAVAPSLTIAQQSLTGNRVTLTVTPAGGRYDTISYAWERGTTAAGSGTSITVDRPTSGTHMYKVTATAQGTGTDATDGTSATSTAETEVEAGTVTPDPCNAAPAVPTVSGNPGRTSIAVSASSSTTGRNAATGYDIEYRLQGASSWSTGSSRITGLTCGTTYEIRARSKNDCGNSSFSGAETVTTDACPPTGCPGDPDVSLSGTGLTRTISASLASDPGGVTLDTQHRESSDDGWTTGNSYTGREGESFQYRARARKSGCDTTYSDVETFTFPRTSRSISISLDPTSITVDEGAGDQVVEVTVTTNNVTANTPTVSRISGSSAITARYDADTEEVLVDIPSSVSSDISATFEVSVTGSHNTDDSARFSVNVRDTTVTPTCPGNPTVSISGSGLSRTISASLTSRPTGTTLDTQYREQGTSSWSTGSSFTGSPGETWEYRARARKSGCTTTYSSVGSVTFDSCPADAEAVVSITNEADPTIQGQRRLTADDRGSVGSVAYRWTRNGSFFSSQSTISVPTPGRDQTVTYQVRVTATQPSQQGCTHETSDSDTDSVTLEGEMTPACTGTVDVGSSQGNQTLAPGTYRYNYTPSASGDYDLDTPSDPATTITGQYQRTEVVPTSAAHGSRITVRIVVTATRRSDVVCTGHATISETHSWTITVNNPAPDPCANAVVDAPDIGVIRGGLGESDDISHSGFPGNSPVLSLRSGPSWVTISGATITARPSSTVATGDYTYRVRGVGGGCTKEDTATVTVASSGGGA